MEAYEHLFVLMVTIWTLGKLFRLIKLPTVFGELLGGIIVGPAMFGLIQGETEVIKVLAELGIFFLMMHTGLKTKPRELIECGWKALVITAGATVLPFVLGLGVALSVGQSLMVGLFIGMGLCVSAVPLVARLFKDVGIENSRAANLALAAAVLGDVFGLMLFSFVLDVIETGSMSLMLLLTIMLKVGLFFGLTIAIGFAIGPYLEKILYRGNRVFSFSLIIALLMGFLAEYIGLHAIIGAFMAGLFIQEEILDQDVFDKIEDRFYGIAYGFLGPIFFASLAFHLDFTAVSQAPVFLFAIILVGIIGKVLGAYVPGRLVGLSSSESLLIGLAMNNRGAVELIIASIGLQKGIIDTTVFSILVLMAFGTTIFSMVSIGPVTKKITVDA